MKSSQIACTEARKPRKRLNWWALGTAWDAIAVTLAHGLVEQSLISFAKSVDAHPQVIRRYQSAVVFSRKLQRDGLIADCTRLSEIDVKSVACLQRLSRYDVAAVRVELDMLLTGQRRTGAELEAIERASRRSATLREAPETNSHGMRLGHTDFDNAALLAFRSRYPIHGVRMTRFRARTLFGPKSLDAVLRINETETIGVRLLAATAKTRVRPRVSEELVRCLAAARIFDAVLLIVQDPADAAELEELLGEIGPCGVGVILFDGARTSMVPRCKPDRHGYPDLRPRFSDALSNLFPPIGNLEAASRANGAVIS